LIPRPSISVLQVTEYGMLGRLLVTAGAVAAVAGLVAATNPDVSEGPGIVAVPVMAAAGIIGAAVGGYHAGKKLDKRVVEIHIVAEDR
jgi:poly(3-hydroxybutyrate) depolymerase